MRIWFINRFRHSAKSPRFIGVAEQAIVGSGIHKSSVNKWESDPLFTIQLADSVKAMAQQLRFTDDELTNPEKPAASWRYRAARKMEGDIKLFLARLKNQLLLPVYLRLKHRYE